MKTADLIPFILLELSVKDKYGIELTKDIEVKTNGKIDIKQPTLYTILKKLEKSKFITSYWLDSEIGGKRHYYKLTENGKAQVATLPSFDVLFNSILDQPDAEETEIATVQPKETILPSKEVFADQNLDNLTSTAINEENTNMLKAVEISKEEVFASNENVSKFIETTTPVVNEEYKQNLQFALNPKQFDLPESIASVSHEDIKTVDFVDLKTDVQYQTNKKVAKNSLIKAVSTSFSMLIFVILSTIISNEYSSSPYYYICVLLSIAIMFTYPIVVMVLNDKAKTKNINFAFNFNVKRDLVVKGVIALAIVVITLIVNIVALVPIGKMFGISNFCNLYAPILLTSVLFIDTLLGYLLLRNKN